MTQLNKSLDEKAIEYAYGSKKDFKDNANQFDCTRRVSFMDGYQSRDPEVESLRKQLEIAIEALTEAAAYDRRDDVNGAAGEIAKTALQKIKESKYHD